jgi:hypothetical protein
MDNNTQKITLENFKESEQGSSLPGAISGVHPRKEKTMNVMSFVLLMQLHSRCLFFSLVSLATGLRARMALS